MRTPHTPVMPYRTIEVLLVGTNRLPDGRVIAFDRERIARICAQANRQLKAAIRFPCAWMHDPRAKPLHLSAGVKDSQLHPDAWLARGYFGEPVKYAQDAATGSLLAKVFIPDEADARQFDKVGQVSPGLWQDWTDETGVRWPGLTIAHIAATPKPIQRHAKRVTEYPATYLSQPARAAAAYLLSFPTRSTHMADEYDDDGTDTEGGETLDLSEVIDLLKKLDIHGMDGVADMPTLVAALKAAVHTKLGDAGEPDADNMGGPSDGDEDNTGGATADVPAPVVMSHPVFQKLAAKVGEYERAERVRRLKGLLDAGKINKTVHDKILATKINAVNLSNPAARTADGVPDFAAIDAHLDVLDDLTPAAGLKRGAVNLSHPVKDVPNPNVGEADKDKADLDKVRAESAKRLGIPLKK